MSKLKVLYAENQPLAIKGLNQILFDNNIVKNFYSVSESGLIDSGIIAYEPDLFIIDYGQKDFFSISDIEKITKNYPNINILVISNEISVIQVKKVLELGVHGFITRQSNADEILLAIKKIMKGEKYFCSGTIEIIENKNDNQKIAAGSSSILTYRELEVVANIGLGKTNKQIGNILGISHHTVHSHRKNIMKKLSVSTLAELTVYAVDNNLIRVF